jgi:hypothetical protein
VRHTTPFPLVGKSFRVVSFDPEIIQTTNAIAAEMLRPRESRALSLARKGAKLSKLALLAVLGPAAIAGCAGEEPIDTALDWRGSFDTLETGTVLVRNPAAPAWDSATAWRLEEELRIGAADGPEPQVFRGIAAVSADERGNIYVLEAVAQEVRVFAPDGTYRRTIGSPGRGPGELLGAFGLARDDRGRLWVPDSRNLKYVVFDPRGTVEQEYRRPLGPVYPFPGVFDTAGRLLDLTLNAGRRQLDLVPVTFSLDPPAFEQWPAVTQRTHPGPAPRSLVSLQPRVALSLDRRGYVWFGTTDEYRIYQRTLQGDTLRIIERPSEAVPLSDSERAALMAELAEFRDRLDPDLIPTHGPAFNRFVLDDAAYLFVNLPGTADQVGRLIDVFDRLGRYLGRMTSPVRLDWMVPPAITRDHLLGVTRDEQNVTHVVRLRLVRPEC